jgi:TPR repeat protein
LTGAAHSFKRAVDHGNALRHENDSVCLQNGELVLIDLKQAAQFFQFAADHAKDVAQNNYGLCLRNGKGISKNLQIAALYFKRAADQGNADGQSNYGLCLQNGEGISIDLKGAADYFKRAVDQGHLIGQNHSALSLQNGSGVSQDLESAAHYLKLSANQGNAEGQYNFGLCLRDGRGISIDLLSSVHLFKLAADQAHPAAQNEYAKFLRDGRGISRDLTESAHYFKLAADQGIAEAQYHRGISLLTRQTGKRDIEGAIRYLKHSAQNGSPEGQFVFGCMAENGIGSFCSVDLLTAVEYYEGCSDDLAAGSAFLGWCLQTGRGIPIDFTISAEYFRKAADSGDADGMNNIGCCFEEGKGVDRNIELAVRYYRRAASQKHADGLFNFGRCLEYGKGIDRDVYRAAKYYRLSASLKNAAAENSFGVCLEGGIGVHKNECLAAQYYERSANQGHPDGANNYGFCLEHGRGVERNIALASEYYKFAADHGHSEGKVNHNRCLRLLGLLDKWNPPDHSCEIVSHPMSIDHLCEIFHDLFENADLQDEDERRLFTSIERSKASAIPSGIPVSASVQLIPEKLCRSDSSSVTLSWDSKLNLTAMKRSRNGNGVELIRRETSILKRLKHPLIVEHRSDIDDTLDHNSLIVTEFAGNGSLANHLRSSKGSNQMGLNDVTRIVRIIVGIALAMRYLHSRGVIHRNLNPDNILFDWDWKVKICDFGHSTFPSELTSSSPPGADSIPNWQSLNSRYLAPECYDNCYFPESDVFSFGLILHEFLAGQPAFPEELGKYHIALILAVDEKPPDVPEFIGAPARALITDCCAINPAERPSYKKIVSRLKKMKFNVTGNVRSAKLTDFVEKIEEWEARNPTLPQ